MNERVYSVNDCSSYRCLITCCSEQTELLVSEDLLVLEETLLVEEDSLLSQRVELSLDSDSNDHDDGEDGEQEEELVHFDWCFCFVLFCSVGY